MASPTAPRPALTLPLLRASWRDWLHFSLVPSGPNWLQWAWTLAFCLSVALAITAVTAGIRGALPSWPRVAQSFGVNLTLSLAIGLTIHGLFALGIRVFGLERLRALAGWRATLFFTGVPIAGVVIGWPLGLTLAGGDIVEFARRNPAALRASIALALGLTLALVLWAGATARTADAERRAAEARLKLLQGQIEPHFLFNTLANVLGLMERDTPRARRMLEAFVEHLRASLGQLRRDDSTLGAELTMVETYLALMGMRMAERLRHRIDADADARAAVLPPLLLQPLVENAIRHGLEPKIEGGEVRIAAWVEEEHLVVEVEDDGLGASGTASPGQGVALDNLRARLASRYGAAATLTLVPREPGMRARIELPYQRETTA